MPGRLRAIILAVIVAIAPVPAMADASKAAHPPVPDALQATGADAMPSARAPTLPESAEPGARRVITLAPHVTEMVYAAGGGDNIVATVIASNYPPPARHITRVGDGLSINAEQLLTLKPDLIIGWQNTLAIQKLTPLLAALHIPVIYSEPRLLDDIADDIERLGRHLGTPTIASDAAQVLRDELAGLRDAYAHRPAVSVFIEVGTGPLYTLGDDTLTNDAITTCGGVNVFEDSSLVAPAVTAESVLVRNPDVVIIASDSPERVGLRADYWSRLELDAARKRHVYGIDPDMLLRPGPRLIDAARELCEQMDRAR